MLRSQKLLYLVTCVAALVAGPVQGQVTTSGTSKSSPRFSVLEGIVADSIHGGTLSGATVLIDGTTLSAVTDDSGHFRIDSIEPGDYRVAVFHPLIDTLGLSLATPSLRMGADSVRQIFLATPSAQTVVNRSCPAAKQRLGGSAVMGKVLDPDTHAPLDSANVSFVWSEVQVGKQVGIKRLESLRQAVTDADGSFIICGIPPNVSGTIQAKRQKWATAEVELAMQGTPLVFQSLLLSAIPVDSTAPVRGNALLSGKVIDQNGAPLPDATVVVQGSPDTARTGPDGKFRLVGLPSGTRGVSVRKIGFSPGGTAVDLSAEKPAEVAMTLIKSNPQLEAVRIEGKMETALKKNGFADRKKMGMGRYLTPKDLDRLQPMIFTDIFRALPGFTVTDTGRGTKITYRSNGCVNFYIDGVQQLNISAAQLTNLVTPQELLAVETYSVGSAPMEYRPPGQNCAIILVWTNRTIPR